MSFKYVILDFSQSLIGIIGSVLDDFVSVTLSKNDAIQLH